MISTYTKHKISAVGSLEIISLTSQAADYFSKQTRLSLKGWPGFLLPCLHWLADDIRGVDITSLPVRLMPLPVAHDLSVMSYGGITQKKTAKPLYEPPKAEKINSPKKSWTIIGAGGDLNPRKSVWPTDGRADKATAVSFLSDKEKVL